MNTVRKLLFCAPLCMVFCSGCTVVTANRVFPKLTWYWTTDAQEQRRSDREERELSNQARSKDWQGDLQKAIDQQKEKNK